MRGHPGTGFDFDTIISRQGTSSLKWEKYRDRDVIPLWVADMDFMSPPDVIEELKKRVDHGIFGYTVVPAELVDTVIRTIKSEYAWVIEPDWIVWLPGLVSGLNVTCRAVGEHGDDVMTAVPVYPPFLTAPALSGRNLIQVPLARDGRRYTFDFEGLSESVTNRTEIFILCNPHNPVGRVFSVEELQKLVDICLDHGIILCSDEIHCGLVLDEDKKHVCVAGQFPEIAYRSITLMAPSKTYNIPGLGCSFAVIPDAGLRKKFIRAKAGIVPDVNVLGYSGALAAYGRSSQWREELLEYLRANRDLVETYVGLMDTLNMSHVEATYLAWIDARDLCSDPVSFFEDGGVGLSDGKYFGAEGFLRLNFGCPRPLLIEALERMNRALMKRG
ncbi:MAG: MalY/PatB family protein [Desulfomonilia bacterium]